MSDSISSLSPDLSLIIRQAFTNLMKDVHTTAPGLIISFDPVKQSAEVQPLIKRIFVEKDVSGNEIERVESVGKLINVPVVFDRGGGFCMTFPVNPGDECEIHYMERCSDLWRQRGGEQIPNAWRMHSYSDAICKVGLSSIPNAITNFDNGNLQIRTEDGTVSFTMKADGTQRYENPNGFVELQADGKFNINGIIFEDHFHDQPNDSGGDTEQPTGPPQ